jgi:hypothetical protein
MKKTWLANPTAAMDVSPQLPNHQHINHVQPGSDELLNGHRDGNAQHVAQKVTVGKKSEIHGVLFGVGMLGEPARVGGRPG